MNKDLLSLNLKMTSDGRLPSEKPSGLLTWHVYDDMTLCVRCAQDLMWQAPQQLQVL